MRKKKIETLGIFGDSYADDNHGHRIQDPDQKYRGNAWVNMLKNDYTVSVYAKAGTSIYYSYKLFMENHMKHDKVIMIVTGERRLHNNFVDDKHNAVNLISTSRLREKDMIYKFDQKALDRLTAFEHYFKYLQDDSIDREIARLMVEEIKRTRPDAILVPMEHDTSKYLFGGVTILSDYYAAQFKSFTEKLYDIKANHLMRAVQEFKIEEIGCYCHLTEEYNQLLYTKMKEALVERKWTDHEIPLLKHERDFDWYFRLRET